MLSLLPVHGEQGVYQEEARHARLAQSRHLDQLSRLYLRDRSEDAR